MVDDDPVHRMVAARILEGQGYQVDQAASGESAIGRILEGGVYQLVVLDHTMPGMSGSDVLARLRGMPQTARPPVVVATASKDEQLEIRLMEMGVDDYIRKPIEPARFAARVGAALRRAAA